MTTKWPVVRKESTYSFTARHDLAGHTKHADAASPHDHVYRVTLIFEHEYNCAIGYHRDEPVIDRMWGGRIRELEGADLNKLMKLPPTSENLACWLLFCWLPRLSDREINFEVTAIRVAKCDVHACEIRHTEAARRAWKLFGGEVA